MNTKMWISGLTVALLVMLMTGVAVAQPDIRSSTYFRHGHPNGQSAAPTLSQKYFQLPASRPMTIPRMNEATMAPAESFLPTAALSLSKSSCANWISLGPEGGWIGNILMHPTDHNVLWAHTANSYPIQFFKSTNGGASWVPCSSVNDYIYASTNDPIDPAILYAAAGNYLYKSTDGGVTWNRYQKDTRWAYTARLYVCPTNHDLLYAAGYYYIDRTYITLSKSSNGGQSWTITEVLPGSYQNGYCYSFGADPKNPNIIYLGAETYDGSAWKQIILKSTDGGTNWQDITGIVSGYAYTIAVDPITPNKIYVGTNNGIYRSTNGGASWQKNDGYVYAYELAIDPKNPDILYAGAYETIFKSTNAGMTWSPYSSELAGDCTCLLIDHTNTNNIFYGSIVGIYKSSNAGMNWSAANSGLIASAITAMAVAPSDPRILYIEFDENAIFKTTDSGNNWTRLSDFLACGDIGAIAVHPTSPNIVYALEGAG